MSRFDLFARTSLLEADCGRRLRRVRTSSRLFENLESRVLMSGTVVALAGVKHDHEKHGGGTQSTVPVEAFVGSIKTPASPGSSLTIDYASILAAAHARDADGDAITFTITNVSDAGALTFTHGGVTAAVVAGTTTLAAGDTLGWTPAAGRAGKRYVFSVLASDGTTSAANSAAIFTRTLELTKVIAVATKPIALEQLAGSATGNGTVMLVRTGNASQPLTVTLNIGGTAQLGVNYTLVGPDGSAITSATPTVTFTAGQNTLNLTVSPIQDNHADPTLTVLVTVAPDPNTSAPSYRAVNEHIAQVKIIDSTTSILPFVNVQTLRSEASATKPGTILISRTGDTTLPLTVPFTTMTGTGFGTQGTDFVLKDSSGNVLTSSVTIAAGQKFAFISVFALNSGATGNLVANFNLTPNSAYTIGGPGKGEHDHDNNHTGSATIRLIIGASTVPTNPAAPTISVPEVDPSTSVNTPLLLSFADLVTMSGASLGSATGPLQLKVTATGDGTLQIKHGADTPIAAPVGTLISDGDFLLWSPPTGATSSGMTAFSLAAHAGTLDSATTSLFKVTVQFLS